MPTLGGSETVDMAAKLTTAQLDHAIELYLAGEAMENIQALSGVSISRLQRERTSRGIPPRSVRDLPTKQIAAAYRAGASEYSLSVQYGVSRGAIANRLKEAGVERRTMSEAAKVHRESLSPSDRKAQVKAANRAARMRRVPEIQRLRHALTVERQGQPGSEGERLLSDLLRERGQQPIIERAIGPYNVDLAMLPIAVEVLGGGFHGVKARHRERTPYILDAGWHLVMVWNHEGRSALTAGAADYLVAFLEQVRRNPPATCQYRVISGDGQLLAARGREDNEFPLVKPPRGRPGLRS